MHDRMPREPPCPWQVLGLTVVHAVTVFVPPPARACILSKMNGKSISGLELSAGPPISLACPDWAIDWRHRARLCLCACVWRALLGAVLCLAFSGRGQGRAAKGSA